MNESVSNGIMVAHGGSLSVHSQGEGHGSSFSLLLPIITTTTTATNTTTQLSNANDILNTVNTAIRVPDSPSRRYFHLSLETTDRSNSSSLFQGSPPKADRRNPAEARDVQRSTNTTNTSTAANTSIATNYRVKVCPSPVYSSSSSSVSTPQISMRNSQKTTQTQSPPAATVSKKTLHEWEEQLSLKRNSTTTSDSTRNSMTIRNSNSISTRDSYNVNNINNNFPPTLRLPSWENLSAGLNGHSNSVYAFRNSLIESEHDGGGDSSVSGKSSALTTP
eukprot:gene8624-17791_t